MSVDEITLGFAGLTNEEQTRVLCGLGTRLTVLSRAFVSAQKKRGVNEICHKIFGQLGHITSNSTQRYPDAVFVELLNAIAEENHLAKEFSNALAFALDIHETNILHARDRIVQIPEGRRTKIPSE